MKKMSVITVQVDDQGRVLLPVEVGKRYGFSPGIKISLEEGACGMRLSRNPHALSRVYIEPTTLCNLDCSTCMRNVWNETPGQMDKATFQRVLHSIRVMQPIPSVFFGGFGEPLTHPGIIEMVAQAHQAGAQVELITNGTLLTPNICSALGEAGLHRVWVSIDGATPQGYADVRLGDALPQIINNLEYLHQLQYTNQSIPRLGIAIVIMKRNIAELPEIVNLGKSLGADQFSISNVYPHTSELREEMLYSRSMYDVLPNADFGPLISLPRLDINLLTAEILTTVINSQLRITVGRQDFTRGADSCPFLEKGSISLRWDGAVSPCLSLIHTHTAYLDDRIRKSNAYIVGNLKDRTLVEIWEDPIYVDFRERLLRFDFSFCTYCNSCNMADSNLEDCFGNIHPACGGCLWAQGFIQCP